MIEFEFVKRRIFSDFLEDEGCCFGTLDPSRLRKEHSDFLTIDKSSKEDFFNPNKDFYWYFKSDQNGFLFEYFCKDVILENNVQARIIISMNGTRKAKAQFLENKLAYHNRKTGERFFVYKIFR